MLIEWTQDYLCGVEIIDQQHKEFVDLVNQYNHQLREGMGRHNITNLFVNLAEYSSIHFNTEEELMDSYNYPDQEAHKERHLFFKRTIAEYILDMRIGKIPIPTKISSFMIEWINSHLPHNPDGEDARFGKFLRDVGAK
jgi:hemerythrin